MFEVVASSDRRGSLIDAFTIEAESRRSLDGFPRGGGMLMLPLPVAGLSASG